MRLVFDEPEGIPDEYTLLGRLVYPRRAYKWMRQRMILRFNTWNATSQCVQSTGTRCESDLFDGALDRMVEKFTAEFPRHRGSLVPFAIYSPIGALLRYVHNDSVSVGCCAAWDAAASISAARWEATQQERSIHSKPAA